LLASQDCCAWGDGRWRADLESLLEQAQSVDPRRASKALVTMNTTVTLADLNTKELRTATLVYPDDVDLVTDGISVFEPLGVALLGCKVGDVIQCPAEQCRRRFRVAEIIHQPEQAGVWYL
jgi:regulator of nucleoside diphosphate kinase